jgi:hypothetical protein
MKIKQILMAVVFTAVLVGCGSGDPKEAGEKLAKEVCEKMKDGEFTKADAAKLMEDAKAGFDDAEEAKAFMAAYMAAGEDCMKK